MPLSHTNTTYQLPQNFHPVQEPPQQKKSISLGVELWQIFTGITVVLTIASMLIYFNDLLPRNAESEYTWVSQNKTTLFNKSRLMKSWFDENKTMGLVGVQLQEGCYRDIQAIEEEGEFYQVADTKIEDFKRQIDFIRTDFELNNTGIITRSGIETYLDAVEEYYTSFDLFFERQELYRVNTLQIQKSASDICHANIDQIRPAFDTFNDRIENYHDTENKTYASWLEHNRSWLDTCENLVSFIQSDEFSNAGAIERVAQFKDGFLKVFQIGFDLHQEELVVLEAEKNVIIALNDLQEWETNYVNNNREMSELFLPVRPEDVVDPNSEG